MSAIDLRSLVPYDVSRSQARALGRSSLEGGGITRRRFLGGSLAAAAGTFAFGWFERTAVAHTLNVSEDYKIRSSCGTSSWPNCGGCLTVDRIIGGCCTGFSTTCPKGAGYHKHDHLGFDLRVNVCQGSPWDGWLWPWSGCCWWGGDNRKNRTWRCHDGWISNDESICRWLVVTGTTGGCPN